MLMCVDVRYFTSEQTVVRHGHLYACKLKKSYKLPKVRWLLTTHLSSSLYDFPDQRQHGDVSSCQYANR